MAGKGTRRGPMAKEKFNSYVEEIQFQRRVWERKPILRKLYNRWYADCVAWFSPLRPVVEVGAGCGNFKEFFPKAVASDVFRGGDWIDLVMDAQHLCLKENGTGNLLAFDVIHHLPRPLEFLRRAIAALKPGGRLIACEPAVSPWSRLVYGIFHHEPIDMKWNLFELDRSPLVADPSHTFANMGIPEILFFRWRDRTLEILPGARLIAARKFAFLLYPLSGGFGYRCFLPEKGLSLLTRVEDAVTRVVSGSLIGLRMLVVLEKRSA